MAPDHDEVQLTATERRALEELEKSLERDEQAPEPEIDPARLRPDAPTESGVGRLWRRIFGRGPG